MINIALFGTSADPPTAGHKAILCWLCEHYDWVAVWASNNPFKSHQSTLEHRKKMLGVLISEIEPHRNNIALYNELSRTRSLETVEQARGIWGNQVDFTLVIGSDLVKQLPRWYQAEKLLSQVQLLVMPRPGYLINEVDLEVLRQLGGRVAIATLNALAVSSTAYREYGDSTALTPPIKDYIHQEQLYAWQNAALSR